MKLILIIFFVVMFPICSDDVAPSGEYSYFSEADLKALLDGPSKNAKWPERVTKYRDFLIRPSAEEYKGYPGILQLEDEKDLEKYSYAAYPKLDISKEFRELFSTVMEIGDFVIGATFGALCNEIGSAILLDSVLKRVEKFYVSGNVTKLPEAYKDKQYLKAHPGDTDLAYIIRRLMKGVSETKGTCDGLWELICKALPDIDYQNSWAGRDITLNIAYRILNLCFLADDKSPDAFGTRVMKLVESINSDPRVKANNLGINYFKLRQIDALKNLDDSTYFPLFIPKGSKLVYGPLDIINYIMNGEMGTPIARVYGNNELKLSGNEIADADCLLAPAKGLTNSIPMGPISSKNSKKEFTEDEDVVTDESEVYTRLSNDVSFKELASNLLNGNVVASGDDLPKAGVSGMIITNNTSKKQPLFTGKARSDNQIGMHDTVAVLFHHVPADGSGAPHEELTRPSELSKLGWYGGYTVYHLPLSEVHGKILDEPMPDNKEGKLKTIDGIIVEAAPGADIGEKIQDVSKYWKYVPDPK